MNNLIVKRKLLGTVGIAVAFLATSFIGVSSASAYFKLNNKNLQFHAVIQSMTPDSMTLLTSSTDPITVMLNSKTKYLLGPSGVGDVIFVVARVKNDSNILALSIKHSSSGGPNDVYGTDGDKVTLKEGSVMDSECPWLRVSNLMGGKTTLVFRINPSTQFIGATGCEDLEMGDDVSITGIDDNDFGFIAKTVIRKDGDDLPEDED